MGQPAADESFYIFAMWVRLAETTLLASLEYIDLLNKRC
jgi:hypothetical protein